MNSDSLETARRLVAEVLELELNAVGPASDVETLAAWDSLGHVKVILALESRLGRALAPPELAQLRGVADLARFLA